MDNCKWVGYKIQSDTLDGLRVALIREQAKKCCFAADTSIPEFNEEDETWSMRVLFRADDITHNNDYES